MAGHRTDTIGICAQGNGVPAHVRERRTEAAPSLRTLLAPIPVAQDSSLQEDHFVTKHKQSEDLFGRHAAGRCQVSSAVDDTTTSAVVRFPEQHTYAGRLAAQTLTGLLQPHVMRWPSYGPRGSRPGAFPGRWASIRFAAPIHGSCTCRRRLKSPVSVGACAGSEAVTFVLRPCRGRGLP